MQVEKRISKLIDCWRVIVGLGVLIISFMMLNNLLLQIVPSITSAIVSVLLALGVYQLGLWLIGKYVTRTITEVEAQEVLTDIRKSMIDEINKGIADGSLQHGPELIKLMDEAGLKATTDIAELGPVLGTLGDAKFYEYVIGEGTTGPMKYNFVGKVQPNKDGSILVPNLEKNFYVVLDGILYEYVPE